MAKRRKNKEYASPEVAWKKEICEQLGFINIIQGIDLNKKKEGISYGKNY